MLWPIVYCSIYFGVYLGRSITTDIMDMWINEVDMLTAVQMSAISCSENPRKEADMTGVVINCTVYRLVTTLHTVNIDNLIAHRQEVRSDGQMIGVKSQKGDLNCSDQWCYQQCFMWFGYNHVHSGNWQFDRFGTKESMHKIDPVQICCMGMSSLDGMHSQ